MILSVSTLSDHLSALIESMKNSQEKKKYPEPNLIWNSVRYVRNFILYYSTKHLYTLHTSFSLSAYLQCSPLFFYATFLSCFSRFFKFSYLPIKFLFSFFFFLGQEWSDGHVGKWQYLYFPFLFFTFYLLLLYFVDIK